MNEYEVGAKYNIAETCVDSVSLDELFELTGEDKEAFLREFCARRLTYGDIYSRPDFLDGICGLYKTVKPENIITTHGAAGVLLPRFRGRPRHQHHADLSAALFYPRVHRR